MRASNALSTGIQQLEQWVEQMKKASPSTPPPVAQNPVRTPATPQQQSRNADGFANGNDLRSRYATALSGTSASFAEGKSTKPQVNLFAHDSFKAFTKPPVALKSPPLPKQPAFVRV